jgi:hypothetical protein
LKSCFSSPTRTSISWQFGGIVSPADGCGAGIDITLKDRRFRGLPPNETHAPIV